MVQQLIEYLRRDRRHVSARERALAHMADAADRGGEHLGLETVIVVDIADVVDQRHAVLAAIVDAADEGRNVSRARIRRHHRLDRREAERDVDVQVVGCESTAGPQPIPGQRHFYGDVLGDFREAVPLLHHAVEIGGQNLGTDRAGNNGADLLQDIDIVAAGLGGERGIGGHAVHKPGRRVIADFLEIGSIEEDFHRAIDRTESLETVYRMKDAALKPALMLGPHPRAGVLLPLPLRGAYDYKLPKGTEVARGLLVVAPLGSRETLGVVWGDAEGGVGDNRLKEAIPLDGHPILPADLCDFVDWVANYTLNAPGNVLAMALRSRQAFEAEVPRTAYVLGDARPTKM